MTASSMQLITSAFMSSLFLASCLDTAAKPTPMTPDPTSASQPGENLVSKTPNTQLPQASPTATKVVTLPLTTGARIWPYSWSLEGELLAYWSWTPEDVAIDYTFPPGSLQFLDLKNNASCESPVEVAYPYFASTLVWTRDGMAWGLAPDGQVFGFFPCQVEGDLALVDIPERILSLSSPPGVRMVVMGDGGVEVVTIASLESAVLLSGETTDFLFDLGNQESQSLEGRVITGAYSPDGMNLGTNEGGRGGPNSQVTRIRSLATGEVRAQVAWDQQPAEGFFGPPVWLDPDQLLVASNVIGGPLLLTTNGQVIEVAPQFFHIDCGKTVCETFAAPSGPTHGFHIVMADPGVSGINTWFMYHSEDARVELLPVLDLLSFSPDGQWLSGILPREGGQAHELWVRDTDSGEAAPNLFPVNLIYVPLYWSPDSTTLAYALTNGVGAFNVRSMDTLDWSIGSYSPISMRWSPDSHRLAVQAYGQHSGASTREALFVLDLP